MTQSHRNELNWNICNAKNKRNNRIFRFENAEVLVSQSVARRKIFATIICIQFKKATDAKPKLYLTGLGLFSRIVANSVWMGRERARARVFVFVHIEKKII